MTRYVDGLPVATNLFEAAIWHKVLEVTYRCGQSATFDPHGLWWHFEQKHWDMQLGQARRHFYCNLCTVQKRFAVRPIRLDPIEATGEGRAVVTLPMPPEREWKAALSRFR